MEVHGKLFVCDLLIKYRDVYTMKPKKFNILIIICTLILWLAACTAPSHTVSDKTAAEVEDCTPTPTETLAPTSTPTPVPTQPPAEDSTFSVTYLDVGQGDSAIIECDGHYMLIDGGDTGCSNQLYSYLKRNEISTLDIVVASHAHEDHVGGLSGALNYAKAELVLCPVTEYDSDAFRDFAKYAGKSGPGITVPKKQDTYPLGSATVTILGLNAAKEGNDTSIIMTVE